jgi:hypothetical protein
MVEQKWLFFRRKLFSSWSMVISLSLIALTTFISGYLLQSILLQGLGGVFGGAALTLAITLVTGREAVREQNAKAANIARKETYYIPIFNELKQIYDILGEAKQKRLPYPQWISGVGDKQFRPMVWKKYPMPSFTNWVTFKEDPYRSNFTEKAYKLFTEVQMSCFQYNEAVSEVNDPVINILTPKIDSVFREWANRDDFKHWKEETNGGNTWSSAQYHEWNSYICKYIQRSSSEQSEVPSLVWAHNLLGWILVDDIDKASEYMPKIYQNDYQTHVTLDTLWFKTILEGVWTELQELPHVKRVRGVVVDLCAKTVQAKDYTQSKLTYIRDVYEGGEPPL